MNQQWRRNIKKAAKAGVEVEPGATAADLPAFHALYVETAERDHFTPRPLRYFQHDVRRPGGRGRRTGSGSTSPTTRATWSRPRSGSGSARTPGTPTAPPPPHKREVRGSNAIQWQMIRDALAAGADVYDLRGITDTLDVRRPARRA